MKALFHIKENTVNTISYYLLAAFAIVLPFDFFYSELILVLFAIHTLIHSKTNSYKNILSWPVILLSMVFLLNIIGMLYSPDVHEAINITTRQLAIFLFPVLFTLSELDYKKYAIHLVCFLGCSCTYAVLYLYGHAVAGIADNHQNIGVLFTAPYMNHNFSLPLGIHATYFSLYCSFSLLVFIYLLIRETQWLYRFMYGFCIIVLTAGIIQLSSRSVCIALLVVTNIIFPLVLFKGKQRILAFAAASLLSAAAVFFIIKHDAFKDRFISELQTDLSSKNQVFEGVEPRWVRWTAAVELIEKAPLAGYGSGAEKQMLQEQFYQKKLFVAYLNELNAHSEYLSICIRAGLLGLLVLLIVLYYGFKTAIKKQDVPFLVFMTLIAIVFIAENVLDTNKGIFFYGFFLSLFIAGYTRQDNNIAVV